MRTPEEIRAEIDATRRELGTDVDLLAEKVSPTRAVERRMGRAKSAMASMREKVMGSPNSSSHSSSSGVGSKISSAGESISGAASSAAGSVSGAASSAAGTISQSASSVADSARSAGQGIADTAAATPGTVRQQTQGNPLAAGVIAFGLGWLVSSLMPATEKEAQLASQVKDKAQGPVKEHLQQVAQEMKGNLQEPVQQAVSSVKQTAQAAATNVQEHGKAATVDITDKARDAAGTVRDEGQDAMAGVKSTATSSGSGSDYSGDQRDYA